ncbi:HAD family hydrolase [Cupriavidus sp. RAF12]|uniref:HAD family hydrolase n=1 Tax=Cupriavidus sp. RAF12 TaxID=3233050 RepID=UPI003F8F01CB
MRHFSPVQNLHIRRAAERLGSTGLDISALEQKLLTERGSIRLFDDTIPTLLELKARGIKLAIASNLAAPYAPPLLDLLPFKFDAYAWSFEVGHLKPSAEIFEWVTSRLGVPAAATLMLGDTYKADYVGALQAGLPARHLVRPPKPPSGGIMIQSLPNSGSPPSHN